MNLFNFFNIQNRSNMDIIIAEDLKGKLNEYLFPFLDDIGLYKWDKNYQWSGDYNINGVKPVFQFVNLKGYSGTFQYGNVFNFIPVLSNDGKVLTKSKKLQLYEMSKGWHASFENNKRTQEFRISLWNYYFFNKTLKKIFTEEKESIRLWFMNNQNLEQNIQTAIIQIEKGGAYNLHSPDQKFVLAFLFAKNGEMHLAKNTLEDYYTPLIARSYQITGEYEKMKNLLSKI